MTDSIDGRPRSIVLSASILDLAQSLPARPNRLHRGVSQPLFVLQVFDAGYKRFVDPDALRFAMASQPRGRRSERLDRESESVTLLGF